MEILTISDELSSRNQKWIICAFKLANYNTAFRETITGIGRLDCSLKSADKACFDSLGKIKIGESPNMLTDYSCLSDLWLMGTYEALRTLDQKIRNKNALSSDVFSLKNKFARVRMPIAKFEAAKAHSKNDKNYINTYILCSMQGKGWILNDSNVYYRNDLADEMLDLFDKFDDTEITLALKKNLCKSLG